MSSSNVFIDRDLGYHRVVDGLADMRGRATLVGIHEEEGAAIHPADATGTGPTLAVIAFTNEMGSKDGVVPERPFMRGAVDANSRTYGDRLQAAAEAAVDGTATLETSTARLGLLVEGDIKAYMTDLQDPPNAPITIARKGSSNPLIDTGRLRASIRAEQELA